MPGPGGIGLPAASFSVRAFRVVLFQSIGNLVSSGIRWSLDLVQLPSAKPRQSVPCPLKPSDRHLLVFQPSLLADCLSSPRLKSLDSCSYRRLGGWAPPLGDLLRSTRYMQDVRCDFVPCAITSTWAGRGPRSSKGINRHTRISPDLSPSTATTLQSDQMGVGFSESVVGSARDRQIFPDLASEAQVPFTPRNTTAIPWWLHLVCTPHPRAAA